MNTAPTAPRRISVGNRLGGQHCALECLHRADVGLGRAGPNRDRISRAGENSYRARSDLALHHQRVHRRPRQNRQVHHLAALDPVSQDTGRGVGDRDLLTGLAFELRGKLVECRPHGHGAQYFDLARLYTAALSREDQASKACYDGQH